jgi:general secretion pathway protein C
MISSFLLSLALTGAAPADLAAVGIVASTRSERSVAVLRAGGRTRMGSIGDTVFGGRIVAISAGAVVVEFTDGPRELRLGAAVAANVAPVRSVAAPPVEAPAGERTLERREVERRLGEEIPRILAETTLLPVTSAGRVAGLTISRMPPGTILSEAGLQAGDILTEVNGVPIDSMATLIALYPRLQGESMLRAHVLRNGQPLTLSLVLR